MSHTVSEFQRLLDEVIKPELHRIQEALREIKASVASLTDADVRQRERLDRIESRIESLDKTMAYLCGRLDIGRYEKPKENHKEKP